MHGLGKGPVYVDVGVEYIDAASEPDGSGEILLGNVSLFKSDAPAGGEERIYNLSTAVKVLPERGTFVVAVNLEKPTGLISCGSAGSPSGSGSSPSSSSRRTGANGC